MDSNLRQQLRTEKSLPVLDELYDWLTQTRVQTAHGGASAKALDYTLKRWPGLVRYAHTGNLPIDNNSIENSIRPIAIGKKIGSLQDLNEPDSAQLIFKPCSAPHNSTASTRPHGSKMSSQNFLLGLTAALTNCCHLHRNSFNHLN